MERIAEIIDLVLSAPQEKAQHQKAKLLVQELTATFPLVAPK